MFTFIRAFQLTIMCRDPPNHPILHRTYGSPHRVPRRHRECFATDGEMDARVGRRDIGALRKLLTSCNS
jgi:hypothetical protein